MSWIAVDDLEEVTVQMHRVGHHRVVDEPEADALVSIDGLEEPVGPGSTIAAVAIANCIKVRTAQLLVEQGAMPPVITRASVVGADRSRELFDEAYREHAQRIARAIGGEA